MIPITRIGLLSLGIAAAVSSCRDRSDAEKDRPAAAGDPTHGMATPVTGLSERFTPRATPREESEWTYGDHEIPVGRYNWMDDRYVEKFNRHLWKNFGIEVPQPSGSYIDADSPYPKKSISADRYSDMNGGNFAFMIPPEAAEDFVLHLKERCAAICERSKKKAPVGHPERARITWSHESKLTDRGFSGMTYTFPPGNYRVRAHFVNDNGEFQETSWVVNPEKGYVLFHSSYGEWDE